MNNLFTAPRAGLEPATTRLTAECSTIELSRNIYLTIVVDFFLSATFNILSHFHRFVNNFFNFFCMYLKNCTQTFHPNLLPFPTLTFWSSPRPISSSQLHALRHFHPCPINLVVFKGSYSYDGISHLEGGFTLRCLQRLSRPDMATRPWR